MPDCGSGDESSSLSLHPNLGGVKSAIPTFCGSERFRIMCSARCGIKASLRCYELEMVFGASGRSPHRGKYNWVFRSWHTGLLWEQVFASSNLAIQTNGTMSERLRYLLATQITLVRSQLVPLWFRRIDGRLHWLCNPVPKGHVGSNPTGTSNGRQSSKVLSGPAKLRDRPRFRFEYDAFL